MILSDILNYNTARMMYFVSCDFMCQLVLYRIFQNKYHVVFVSPEIIKL